MTRAYSYIAAIALVFTFELNAYANRAIMEAIPASNTAIYVDTINSRVGISTAIPQSTLDINGAVRISSALVAGTDPGTYGYMLVSSGPGYSPFWQAASSSVFLNKKGDTMIGNLVIASTFTVGPTVVSATASYTSLLKGAEWSLLVSTHFNSGSAVYIYGLKTFSPCTDGSSGYSLMGARHKVHYAFHDVADKQVPHIQINGTANPTGHNYTVWTSSADGTLITERGSSVAYIPTKAIPMSGLANNPNTGEFVIESYLGNENKTIVYGKSGGYGSSLSSPISTFGGTDSNSITNFSITTATGSWDAGNVAVFLQCVP